MARRIDKGHDAIRRFDLIGADVLGNAASLARDHIGLAQRIEQRRLTVIDVAHDGHDRRTRFQLFFGICLASQPFDHIGFRHALDLMAHFLGDELCGISIDQIIDRVHLALFHQELDDVHGALGHAVGEFLNSDRLWNDDFAAHLLGRTLEALCLLLEAFGTTTERGDRTSAIVVLFHRIGNGQTAAALVRLALGAGRNGWLDVTLDCTGTRASRSGGAFIVLYPHPLGGHRRRLHRLRGRRHHRRLRCQFLGRFFSLAPAFFLGPVAGLFFGLAFRRRLALDAVAFILFTAPLGLFLLAFAVFGLANASPCQSAVPRLLFLRRKCTQHDARALGCRRGRTLLPTRRSATALRLNLGTRLGRRDRLAVVKPLALGFHNHRLAAAMGKALLHLAMLDGRPLEGQSPASATVGVSLAVFVFAIGHSVSSGPSGPVWPSNISIRRAATRSFSASPPLATAACITFDRPKAKSKSCEWKRVSRFTPGWSSLSSLRHPSADASAA